MNDESQFVKKTETESENETKPKIKTPTIFEIKVVNLERRPDRKEQTVAKFKEQNIAEYKFIEAVDGQNLDVGADIIELFKGNDFGSRKGFIGCALSHYNLWKKLLESPDEYYFIMEDDVQMGPDFSEKLKSIYYSNYDILFFGYSMFSSVREKIGVDGEFTVGRLSMNQYVGGTFAYSINRTGAKKMIDYIEKNGINTELIICSRLFRNWNVMSQNHNCVFQNGTRMERKLIPIFKIWGTHLILKKCCLINMIIIRTKTFMGATFIFRGRVH
jgi:GR25 family glycosyltransferase involved in LPS biosynthesis